MVSEFMGHGFKGSMNKIKVIKKPTRIQGLMEAK